MLSIAITPECVEAALAAGELSCPACSTRLSPWGFARSRDVRLAHEVRPLTPRRARAALTRRGLPVLAARLLEARDGLRHVTWGVCDALAAAFEPFGDRVGAVSIRNVFRYVVGVRG